MGFSPIAIVGHACVLPGALAPAQLWDAVAAGRDLLTAAPQGHWRMETSQALCAPDRPDADRAWSDRGGYVRGFEAVWNPEGFAVPAGELDGLDRLVHWTLHCAREALGETRRVAGMRTGAIFGNLGFPSPGMATFAEGVWTGDAAGDPRNRFMSAGTADVLRRALRLDAGSHCIDAACASSLYAIKLACDRLHDGAADLMLAGAVQGADDLFLHVGFCALNALSRSGRSRPFHRDADGLVPAEGAAFVALKRLADARRDGDTIHGMIRGIGLSNDGRGKGLLAPAAEGQRRAIRAAYASAGFGPERVSLLECHATGTTVGDATELESTGEVFAACDKVPIGSLKSNLGHLITTAGAAGLIKVLEAMRTQQRPPTLHVDAPSPVLAQQPFRVLDGLEAWPSAGPRIAAVSAFGFGGNNAHLIVSEHDPSLIDEPATPTTARLAIVAIGAIVGSASNSSAFRQGLCEGRGFIDAAGEGRADAIELDLEGLRFPPRDLAQTLPQQLAILKTSREALAETTALPRERTGVFIGMEPDPEVARYGTRWRLAQPGAPAPWLDAARDAVVPALESAGVVGSMPNIPANRLSSQFDLAGPAFTVQAGAASGLVALRIAARAIAHGEIDSALVGAVDLSCEPVQRHASRLTPGDASISLVIKRLDDARRDGDRVYAEFEATAPLEEFAAGACFGNLEGSIDLAGRMGTSFAASGLVHVAAAALCVAQRCGIDGAPRFDDAGMQASVRMADGEGVDLHGVRAGDVSAIATASKIRCYSGADRQAVEDALEHGRESLDGPARMVLVADDECFADVRERALAHLRQGAPAGAGVHFRERPIAGETAFVFAGAGAAYHGMGSDLLRHIPQLRDRLAARSARLADALAWAYGDERHQPSATEQLWGASALSQLHVELSRGLLGIQPDAWLGYSSGETNALIASGTWNDADALMTEMEASRLVSYHLGGEFAAIARAWGRPVQWATWTILAPLDDVRRAIGDATDVHVAIINGEQDVLIAGDEDACVRVVARIGESLCLRLVYPLAVHVPELDAVASEWLQLHSRPTSIPRGRIYANAFGCAYVPDTATCARAILEQADRTLDVRPTILAAWNDGVRVFIEHGPRSAYGRVIREILGEREALIVSLDRQGQGIEATLNAVAALMAAGVRVRHEVFGARSTALPRRLRTFAAHPPLIVLPSRGEAPVPASSELQIMRPAPRLPSALDAGIHFEASPRVVAEPVRPVALDAHSFVAHSRALPLAHPVASLYQGQVAHLVSAQQAFVAQQAQVHQRFIATRAASMRVLLQAAALARVSHATYPAIAPAPASRNESAGRKPALVEPLPLITDAAATLDTGSTRSTESIAVGQRVEASTAHALRAPVGPSFDRRQLEVHSAGRIADIFGPAFAAQDGFVRQVRMPMPPLLLADRVIGIDAQPGSMGKGTIWTQTDVGRDPSLLHQGHLPAGILIESGQADLMLISYLGVDRFNRGERVYRLLGCELTYHGDLPRDGDTLAFEITLDGHAAQGDVRLMFFHYECRNGDRRQLSVRGGQAGFFTDAELAASAGCLWIPEQQDIVAEPRLDAAVVDAVPTALDRAQLEALANGDAFGCFGKGFEFAKTHSRTPGLQGGPMLLLDRVTTIDPAGGPWQRGYLRAELDITPQQWFFEGHFKNDPCMPGTLMLEACLQALAIYLAAQGHTLQRDGWSFQPVPEIPYQLQCRGQVIPTSQRLVTEVFVEELIAGPIPTVYADLLCTVDGLKAFHARRVALQLVPDWPLAKATHRASSLSGAHADVAVVDGFAFDARSILACAIGRPSEAFGPMYRRFDGTERVARLPGPPYLFMSRIREVHGPIGVMKAGARAVVDYDVPADAWYFDRNGCRTMPFAVLLEAALQPCGWLSSYVGSTLTEDSELGFRNLDGEGLLLAELHDDCGTLTTHVELTSVSATGGMIVESFAVRCFLGAREVYRLETVFGFFPPPLLARRVGLREDGDDRALFERASNTGIALASIGRSDASRPRIADGMLLMIDRIEGYWPDAGAAGLGQLRAVKDIDAGDWFFKAHFFQDPVQPGSLGLEAMLQALQFHMLHAGMDRGFAHARFEPIALDRPHRWKYRGQVLANDRKVHTTLEIIETGRDERGVYALANASLWADGQRIYELDGLGMRIVSAEAA